MAWTLPTFPIFEGRGALMRHVRVRSAEHRHGLDRTAVEAGGRENLASLAGPGLLAVDGLSVIVAPTSATPADGGRRSPADHRSGMGYA